jgi:hypothetical protein
MELITITYGEFYPDQQPSVKETDFFAMMESFQKAVDIGDTKLLKDLPLSNTFDIAEISLERSFQILFFVSELTVQSTLNDENFQLVNRLLEIWITSKFRLLPNFIDKPIKEVHYEVMSMFVNRNKSFLMNLFRAPEDAIYEKAASVTFYSGLVVDVNELPLIANTEHLHTLAAIFKLTIAKFYKVTTLIADSFKSFE